MHSTIKASATAVDGVGGTIRMTSDGVTSVGGTLAATGGAAGGLIETSAANSLRVTSVPDASASRATGKAGTWLMDPGNVQIVDDEADGFLPAEADGETTIHNRTIDAALNGGTSVTISTGTGADFDIVQGTAITKSAGNAATLTLNASRNVELNAPITSTSGALNLVVNANLADDAVKEERSAVGGTVVLAASMSLAGGSLTVAGLATNVREKIDAGDVTFDSAVVMRPEAQIVARSVSFGSAAIVAGSIKASGPVTFAAPITLAADTTITTTGGKGSGVTFPSTVDTLTAGELEFADAAFDATVPTQNASLTVTASGPIRFDGTIGGDLPTGGGSGGARALLDFKACSETVLTLNVPSINATRDVDLNFCGKTTIPATATIVGPQDDLHIVAGREISSGVNEKITVVGALRLDAPTVTVGDVSTLGDFDVNTQTLIIRRRAAGQVLGRNGSMTNDLGVDIVSGGDIDLNATGTVQLRGTSGRLFLAAGGTITRTPFEADTIEHSAALRVTPDDFSFGGTVLDLDAGSASGGDPSPPIAGAVPRVNLVIDSDLRRPKEGIAVSAALREVLNDLGVYARVLAPTEYVELTRGFGTYDDVPKRLGAEDDEYTVAINRLQYDPVIPVAQQYYTLFYGKPLDLKSGRPSLVAADRRDGEIKRELGGGWAAFEAASDGKADPGAFEAYLRADPTRADAAATLADLRSLFRAVDGLGLNPNEVRIAKAILVRRSLPPQMRPSDMIGALRAPPASGSPAAAPSLVAGPGAKPTASTITP